MSHLKQFIRKYGLMLNILMFLLNVIVLGAGTYNAIRISQDMRILSSEAAIERISHNLGIPPDWQALWWYIDDTMSKGMPREAVHRELEKVGPYVIVKRSQSEDYDICETVEFQGLTKLTHNPVWFCYRDNEVKSLENFGTAIDD